jgi:hypothetical protein
LGSEGGTIDTGPNAHEHYLSALLEEVQMTYSSDSLGIKRGLDMPLGDQTRNQVSGDDTALGMGCEEDSVGPTEIVDPSWVGQIRLVQP